MRPIKISVLGTYEQLDNIRRKIEEEYGVSSLSPVYIKNIGMLPVTAETEIEGRRVPLNIWLVTTEPEYRSVREEYVKGSKGIVVCATGKREEIELPDDVPVSFYRGGGIREVLDSLASAYTSQMK